jgi:hypothetical protein
MLYHSRNLLGGNKMFSIDANNKIALTRGDSAEIQVKVIDKNGVER